MIDAVCVDASLIVSLLIPETHTDRATALWQAWIEDDLHVLAPSLLGYEVTAAIHQRVSEGEIEAKDGEAALEQFLAMYIETVHAPELHIKATSLATQFERPSTHDAHYLAVAEHFACPLWTADERLFDTVKGRLDWVRWVGEPEPAGKS
jgi:predicted nucleic acid-binding protein